MKYIILLLVGASTCLSAIEFSSNTLVNESKDSAKIESLLGKAWELRSNDPIEATNFANEALVLAQELGDNSAYAQSLNYLGVIHTNIGANNIALEYHIEALKIAQEENDWQQIGYSYNNIGGVYRIQNELELSSENILKGISVFEKNNFGLGLAYCYLNLGRLYKDQENYKQSMSYLDKALEITKSLSDDNLRSKVLLEIAEVQKLQGFYNSAEIIYNELVGIYKELNIKKGLAEAWNNLSSLYRIESKYEKAIDYSLKALELNREILNVEGEIKSLINLAKIYIAQNKKSLAEQTLYSALNKSKQIKIPQLLLSVYLAYYELFKSFNQNNNALYYHELYHLLKDSLVTNEEMVKLGKLESLIEMEKTKIENLQLQNDLQFQKTQRNFILAIALLSILLVGFISYRFYEKKKLNEELKRINTVKDKFFRIIAHDLREPFNAIFAAVELLKDSYGEMSVEETQELIDTIGKSIKSDFDLLENLLLWARSQSDTILFDPKKMKLCKIVQDNIKIIESGLKNKSISVNVDCSENLEIYADEQMFNTIMRNLLLNAVKFTNINGSIKVTCKRIEDNIVVNVKDSGIGMNEETLGNLFRLDKKVVSKGTAGEVGSGLGLIITKEFIEKHNGNLSVESKINEGSTFTIEIPNS